VPTTNEHSEQARRSAELANLLERQGEFENWALVARAYSALHLVEAFFGQHGAHFSTLLSRNRAVEAALPSIARAYLRLQDASRTARYERWGALRGDDYASATEDFHTIEAELSPRL
jgi:hypothetical protein